MNIYKSILFSTVITGVSVSNLQSTLSYSPYIMGELSKADQEYKSALRTHNISHQKFPKIQPLNIPVVKQCNYVTSCEESIISFEEYAANFFANYLQNWLNLFDHMPQNTSNPDFFSVKVRNILYKPIQVPTKYTPPSKTSEYEQNLQFRINIAHYITSEYNNSLRNNLSNLGNCNPQNILCETVRLIIIFIKLFLTEYYLYSPPVHIISLIEKYKSTIQNLKNIERLINFLKIIKTAKV